MTPSEQSTYRRDESAKRVRDDCDFAILPSSECATEYKSKVVRVKMATDLQELFNFERFV